MMQQKNRPSRIVARWRPRFFFRFQPCAADGLPPAAQFRFSGENRWLDDVCLFHLFAFVSVVLLCLGRLQYSAKHCKSGQRMLFMCCFSLIMENRTKKATDSGCFRAVFKPSPPFFAPFPLRPSCIPAFIWPRYGPDMNNGHSRPAEDCIFLFFVVFL